MRKRKTYSKLILLRAVNHNGFVLIHSLQYPDKGVISSS